MSTSTLSMGMDGQGELMELTKATKKKALEQYADMMLDKRTTRPVNALTAKVQLSAPIKIRQVTVKPKSNVPYMSKGGLYSMNQFKSHWNEGLEQFKRPKIR